MIVTALVYWLSGNWFTFIVAGLQLGFEDVAALRALQNFVLPLSQFLTSPSPLAILRASGKFASNDRKAFRKTTPESACCSSLPASFISLFCLFAGPPLVSFVYKRKIRSNSPRCFLWPSREHLSPPPKDRVSRCGDGKCPPMFSSATPSPHASQLDRGSAWLTIGGWQERPSGGCCFL